MDMKTRDEIIETIVSHMACYATMEMAFYGPSRAVYRALLLQRLTGERVAKSNPRVGWHRWIAELAAAMGLPEHSTQLDIDLAIRAWRASRAAK